ncbi:MAG: hypothetical protein NXI01_03255 [Gammaproteobacteria bacterium]|nr:hypothetical protein [Gammaproteobacteria bacterium]
MKKIVLSISLLFLFAVSGFALSVDDFPDMFEIKNKKHCRVSTSCVKVKANKQIVGKLILIPYHKGTFHFLNEQNKPIMTVTLKKITQKHLWENGYQLEEFVIVDNNQQLLATFNLLSNVRNQWIAFHIFAKDGQTILASGQQIGVSGTQHLIYEKNTDYVLAELSRSYFTTKRNSKIKVLDKSTLLASIDPNVFAAVIALYSRNFYDFDRLEIDPEDTFIKNLTTPHSLSNPLRPADKPRCAGG